MKTKQIPGIPVQRKGGSHNTESLKHYNNSEIVLQKFAILKNRFYSINQWKDYCGDGFADFKLFDSSGNFKESTPEEGDYIRIDIPGPGSGEAKGFDWVQITKISEDYTKEDEFENILIICTPSKSPEEGSSPLISHFYSSEASSTFMISRGNTYVKAAVYGRNEIPNMNARFLDRIRNILIGIGGMAGVSKIQWKRLSDALLDY